MFTSTLQLLSSEQVSYITSATKLTYLYQRAIGLVVILKFTSTLSSKETNSLKQVRSKAKIYTLISGVLRLVTWRSMTKKLLLISITTMFTFQTSTWFQTLRIKCKCSFWTSIAMTVLVSTHLSISKTSCNIFIPSLSQIIVTLYSHASISQTSKLSGHSVHLLKMTGLWFQTNMSCQSLKRRSREQTNCFKAVKSQKYCLKKTVWK